MEKYAAYQPPKRKGFYLDPRTKILFMAFVTTLMFFVYENLCDGCCCGDNPVDFTAYQPSGADGSHLWRLFALALVAKLTQGMYVLPDILNMISVLLIAMVIRLFPIFMLGYYIIESTKTDEFVAAMEKWRGAGGICHSLSVVFRFIPTLGEESAANTDAMRMARYPIWYKEILASAYCYH